MKSLQFLTTRPRHRVWRSSVLVATAAAVVACSSTPPVVESARQTYNEGKPEESLAQLLESLAKNPRDPALRVAYLSLRDRAINDWMAQAARAVGESNSGERARLYRRVLALDPENSRARAGMEMLERDARLSKDVLDAQLAMDTKDYAQALAKLRGVLREDPQHAKARTMLQTVLDKTTRPAVDPVLAQALQKTLNIDFKDATLKQVFDVLARTADISFVLDKDIKLDQRTTLSVKDVTVKDAIETVLLTNQLEQRMQGRKTIVVYPNTAAKQKDYQPLKVRTFFLANAEAEQVANTLKTVLKSKDVVVDKAQNAIVLRDTAGALQMAERLVAVADLPTPETMIEIEVMEVSRDRLQTLGVQWPSSVALTPMSLTSGGTLSLDDLKNLSYSRVGVTVGATTISATGQDADVKTLANPRIRVKNRETAKILIGDRVPNITSTSTSTGFVSESVQYLDVGLKVEITPTITIDNEVALKVSLEVSSVDKEITTSNGTNAYQIGTRSASTVLRLKDGENQVLAGLINEKDNRTINKIPGLGDLPIAGKLFSSDGTTKSSSEIVLSITPRLVRNLTRPDAGLLEFDSGTEANLRGSDGDLSPAPAPQRAPALPTPGKPATAPGTGATGTSDAASQAATAGTAGLAWSAPTKVAAGSTFSADLGLSATQGVASMTLVLGFDPAVLQVSGVSEGTALNGDGTMTTFSQRVDASTGQIFISTARPSGAQASSTQGTAARLTLTASANGGDGQLRVASASMTAADGTVLPVSVPAALTVKVEKAAK